MSNYFHFLTQEGHLHAAPVDFKKATVKISGRLHFNH